MPDEGTVSYDEIRRHSAPRIREILEAMDFEHLEERNPELALVSKPFCDLAHLHAAAFIAGSVDDPNVHLEHGLWRLLEAKDALVRAALSQ